VINQQNTARKAQILQNRKNLKPIIEAVICLGRQEQALRGHRDAGDVIINSDFISPNECNQGVTIFFLIL